MSAGAASSSPGEAIDRSTDHHRPLLPTPPPPPPPSYLDIEREPSRAARQIYSPSSRIKSRPCTRVLGRPGSNLVGGWRGKEVPGPLRAKGVSLARASRAANNRGRGSIIQPDNSGGELPLRKSLENSARSNPAQLTGETPGKINLRL